MLLNNNGKMFTFEVSCLTALSFLFLSQYKNRRVFSSTNQLKSILALPFLLRQLSSHNVMMLFIGYLSSAGLESWVEMVETPFSFIWSSVFSSSNSTLTRFDEWLWMILQRVFFQQMEPCVESIRDHNTF